MDIGQIKKSENLTKGEITIHGIPDEAARIEILSFLKELRASGVTRVSIIDIMQKLHLPGEQVERVMASLGRLGVKELD